MTPRRYAALVWIGTILMGAIAPTTIAAAPDYLPTSTAWNGLSGLLDAAEAAGVPLIPRDRLDIGSLTPKDAILVLYPTRPLPGDALTAFMRAGGRVGLADDYGQGGALLEAFRITRLDPALTDARKLRGNDSLRVAAPAAAHALTEGVGAIVTNHPQAIAHATLQPIVELGAGEALVLAGAVGEGRLVALGDPSTLINNMLRFRGNRRFAANLVHYLDGGRGGHVYLIAGDAAIGGRFGEPGADRPLHDVRRLVESLATLELPAPALRWMSAVLAAILLLAAATALPKQTPYEGAGMFPRASSPGGFVGRVQFFRAREGDLLLPALAYKFELEEELTRRLSLGRQALLRDVVGALRVRNVPSADIGALNTLLSELDELRRRQDHPPAPPRVSSQRFRDMVATGERILARLDPHRTSSALPERGKP